MLFKYTRQTYLAAGSTSDSTGRNEKNDLQKKFFLSIENTENKVLLHNHKPLVEPQSIRFRHLHLYKDHQKKFRQIRVRGP